MPFELKAVFAKEENLKLSHRVKLGLKERAKQGKYKASVPPYGYKMNPHTNQLEVDERTAPYVKRFFIFTSTKGGECLKLQMILCQGAYLHQEQ